MDPIDEYIERLSEPDVRSYWRRVNNIDEDEGPGPHDGSMVREEDVDAADETLGIPLPPSYRKLVTTTEPYDNVYGIYWVVSDGGIVWANRDPDSVLPPFLIAVIADDSGDQYCFDTRYPDERGEYPIVRFDHEIHDETSTDCETVAKDLGEFLLGSLGGETSS
jgi:SMI1-KNR4 cell-wall